MDTLENSCLSFFKLNILLSCMHVCVCCVCVQLCLTLCNPMDCSLPGSSVHGIFQVRILEWAAISPSKESSHSRDWFCVSCVSCIGRWILYLCTTWKAHSIYHMTSNCAPGQFMLDKWKCMLTQNLYADVHETFYIISKTWNNLQWLETIGRCKI